MSMKKTYDKNPTIVVTGHLGFIGFHLSKRLIEHGFNVVGIDSLNDYYDQELKEARGRILNNIATKNYQDLRHDLSEASTIEVLKKIKPDFIINLAAQAGVRHSLVKPGDYVTNNINSFLNILEYLKENNHVDLMYASTSSIYGGLDTFPFHESLNVNKPLQFYAVTKHTNEMMAEAYGNLYDIRSIGFRFFTVYGPWGRPDMSLFLFTKNILEGNAIDVFNMGNHERDFTYIDDIVDGIISTLKVEPKKKLKRSEIFNLGAGRVEKLMKFINEIEKNLDKKAKLNFMPLQKGDVEKTSADINKMKEYYGYSPKINIEIGVAKFVEWYLSYYKKN